ncbi:hypothetical protein D3C85_1276180 [compost metagenome]
MGLFDHVIERLELAPQQQRAKYSTQCSTQQQPTQAAQGALPELGQGKHRVADHLHPCSLLPAAADDGIATGRLQADQSDEPGRHTVTVRHGAALDQ